MSGLLNVDQATLEQLCRRFHVRRLSLFGSVATGHADAKSSDVDLLVEFLDGTTERFDAYFDLKEELERLLGRPVDLVSPKALENPYFAASVDRTRRDLYAA